MLIIFGILSQTLGLSVNLTEPICSNQVFNSLNYVCEQCTSPTVLYQNRCICGGVSFNQCSSLYTCSNDGSWSTSQCSCSGHAYLTGIGCEFCPYNQNSVGTGCGCTSGNLSDGRCVTASATLYNTEISKKIGPKAQEGCNTYNDMVSCQQLVNLCSLSLSLSTYTASSICALVSSYQTNYNIPIMKFTKSGKQLIEEPQIQFQINFKEDRPYSLYKAPIYVMEYYLDGTVGVLKPLQNQLQICSTSYGDAESSSKFGVDYRKECDMDLSRYQSRITYQTIFYQLWLKDLDGSYIPIPVYTSDSAKGNVKFDPTQYNTFEFVSRFFIIDNQQSSTELYYAKKVNMVYYLSTSDSDKTFVPYLYIQYAKQTYSNTTTTTTNIHATYDDQFFQADTKFYSVAGGLLIAMNVIVIIIWVIKLWVWSKRNPPYTAEQTWIVLFFIKAFYCLLDTWAEATFYYLFFMTGYWFCFFKFQQTVFVLMPSRDNYEGNYQQFEILFHMMFACRLISLINMILQQTEMEVFFIDWEKSEVRRPVALDNQLDPTVKHIIEKYESKKSAWRTLLIANEFNELQVYRIVSVEWTLFFVGFFLIGLGWQGLAAQQPNLSLNSSTPQNYVLQYFLCNFLYLCIGLSQIIIQKIFDVWFPIQVEDFVDLCSIANVSIMILDDALHGYYIHGENPIGLAEGSSEHLAQCLHYEAMGKGKRRGLIQEGSEKHREDSELQTFEMFVPLRFRMAYDTVFKLPIRQITDQAQYGGYGEIQIMRNPLPGNLDMKEVEIKRNVIQYYIKDILSQVRNNFQKIIRDKLPLQRFLSYPPADLEDYKFKDQSVPVFYRDPDQNFKNVFFCGHEFFFLITDTMIFNFWMILTNNVYLSIMLTYLITTGVFNYRAWLGERNLSDQSKIDQRFLI